VKTQIAKIGQANSRWTKEIVEEIKSRDLGEMGNALMYDGNLNKKPNNTQIKKKQNKQIALVD
jgi:hypothetical protein